MTVMSRLSRHLRGCGKTKIRCRLGNGVEDDRNLIQLMFAMAMVGDILLPERRDLLLLSRVLFSQSISIGKIKPSQRFHKENNMRILFVLSFSLMIVAPQSFAQKDDYSKLNEKNCGVDALYKASGSSSQDTMREAHEEDRENYLRKRYRGLRKEERSGWSEDAFVEARTKTGKWWKEKKG